MSKGFKLAFSVFAVVVMIFFNLYSDLKWTNEYSRSNEVRLTRKNQTKTILLWNANPERVEIAAFGIGRKAFDVCKTPYEQCELISDKRKRPIESFDAILINIPIFKGSSLMIKKRLDRQRLIFFSQESPVHTWGGKDLAPEKLNGFFNWTMTYRLDSDIPLFYGRIQPRPITSLSSTTLDTNISNKTKLVAWMVSHCSTASRREEYVEELMRHVEVEVYGDCGTYKCARSWDFQSSDCYRMLESRYKFYLSFENSICTDYVTEKFYLALQRNIVPIVYGGADYRKIAPPHSYIDARRFKPKELADYLLKLDTNDTLYKEYFRWKQHYIVEAGMAQMARYGFCHLCHKLHTDDGLKLYHNISEYFGLNTCKHLPNKKMMQMFRQLGLSFLKSIL